MAPELRSTGAMQLTEWLGRAASVAVAPVTFTTSVIRRARVFHPSGFVHRAEVTPHEFVPQSMHITATRLSGPALVRLSSALFQDERPDVLGVGVTIRGDAPPQDLLFASARSLLALPFAFATTNVHDFLANEYFAIAPFQLDGVGRVRMRLRPRRGPAPRRDGPPHTQLDDREVRIDEAAALGAAAFDLEIRPGRGGLRGLWVPFLTIQLHEEVELPDDALELTPFHDGRGLHPVGFVNAVRRLSYAASRAGRRLTRRGSTRVRPI